MVRHHRDLSAIAYTARRELPAANCSAELALSCHSLTFSRPHDCHHSPARRAKINALATVAAVKIERERPPGLRRFRGLARPRPRFCARRTIHPGACDR
jgi:hypothetical protein